MFYSSYSCSVCNSNVPPVLQMAEEITKPLSATQKITMVSSGGSEVGAAKLTGEVLDIMTRLPSTVEKLTGVDITQVSSTHDVLCVYFWERAASLHGLTVSSFDYTGFWKDHPRALRRRGRGDIIHTWSSTPLIVPITTELTPQHHRAVWLSFCACVSAVCVSLVSFCIFQGCFFFFTGSGQATISPFLRVWAISYFFPVNFFLSCP